MAVVGPGRTGPSGMSVTGLFLVALGGLVLVGTVAARYRRWVSHSTAVVGVIVGAAAVLIPAVSSLSTSRHSVPVVVRTCQQESAGPGVVLRTCRPWTPPPSPN